MPIRLLLSGGGSGGHLVPGIELGRRVLASGGAVHLVRGGRAIESEFVDIDGLVVHGVPSVGRRFGLPLTLARSVASARRLMEGIGVDVVVGLGGRASVPCVVAALTLRIPVALLEQNVVPGAANRRLARFARRIYTAFPETAHAFAGHAARCTGTPLRPELGRLDRRVARLRYGASAPLTVVVLGGSQGALALNEGVPVLIGKLDAALRERLHVVHITGPNKEAAVAAAYAKADVSADVRSFEREVASLYALADLVICRGGGTTLAELAAARRAGLVVPYPWHADQHQLRNAQWFAARGGFRVLPQAELGGALGRATLTTLLTDDRLRESIARDAHCAIARDGARTIARDLRRLCAGPAVGGVAQ